METRNILVIGVWLFALIWLVGMLVLQADLLVSLFIFLIAIVVSVAATALPTTSPASSSREKASA
ncbi:MAG TPA: hypothetical protein VFF30_11655 [Nitrososphaerales archaeon]|nr:hypothetical protein [Nitrososphaerales archaeon]